MERRDFLANVAVLAAGGLAGCAADQPPATSATVGPDATGIDVHCHIFNARDLPIPGFVLHVFLEQDPAADIQFGAAVTLVALILDQSARGADAELAALDNGTQRVASAVPAAQAKQTRAARFAGHVREATLALQNPNPDARSKKVIETAHNLLSRRVPNAWWSGTENITGAAAGQNGTTPQAYANRDKFLRQVAGMTSGSALPGLSRPGHTAPAPAAVPQASSNTNLADAVAAGVGTHVQNQSGVLYMASLMTGSRLDLAKDLAALPQPSDQGQIALYTPALVDFSYWLADNAEDANDPNPTAPPGGVTPLRDQIRVMSALAKTFTNGAKPGFGVHPFVSFCPWRQVAEMQSPNPVAFPQMQLIEDAILNEGFIGIKLYPLMGYRPTGNANIDPGAYKARLRALKDFRNQLDLAMEALYVFCERNDVPIMAHCSFSQFSSVSGGLLGGPQGWFEVLQKHPKLRLNLAHCGGVWDLAANRRATVTSTSNGQITKPWPGLVIEQLNNPAFENLYADIADFDDVLSCTKSNFPPPPAEPAGGDASAVTALARLVAANPGARRKLMYGTDYMFLVQSPGTQDYLSQMRGCLAQGLGINPADLMGGNASRFLGLNNAQSKTRKRLDAFRGDGFLARFS